MVQTEDANNYTPFGVIVKVFFKNVAYFGNEVGPGVLQSSIQQACFQQECQTTKAASKKHSQWSELWAFGIFAELIFSEYWIGALVLRSNFAFEQSRFPNNFVLGTLYCATLRLITIVLCSVNIHRIQKSMFGSPDNDAHDLREQVSHVCLKYVLRP